MAAPKSPAGKMMELSSKQTKFYAEVYERKRRDYVQLCKTGGQFFDVVVLTASDEEQKRYFEQMLTERWMRKEIPTKSTEYHVIADPPGARIGCGGSTLEALCSLDSLYGAMLDEKRVLIINAGGSSMRLPSHSAIGKIFASAPLPVHKGSSATMLEVKLVVLVDIAARMRAGGVFISPSDEIEFFESADLDLTLPGVTALAHPVPRFECAAHGVFALDLAPDDPRLAGPGAKAERHAAFPPTRVRRYLHKPTDAELEAARATTAGGAEAFVDSNFAMDAGVRRVLTAFGRRRRPFAVELDCYGDFLQALGAEATTDWVRNARNVAAASSPADARSASATQLGAAILPTPLRSPAASSAELRTASSPLPSDAHAAVEAEAGAEGVPEATVSEDLAAVRLELCEVLRGVSFHALALVPSIYFHVGTMQEYLAYFTGELRRVRTELPAAAGTPSRPAHVAHAVKLNSVVGKDVRVGLDSVVDSSQLSGRGTVGRRCILSDLYVAPQMDVAIPDGILLQTLTLSRARLAQINRPLADMPADASALDAQSPSSDAAPLYVTAVFGVDDGLKDRFADANAALQQCRLWGVALVDVARAFGLDAGALWSADPGAAAEGYGLWNARLFPVAATREQSTQFALEALSALRRMRDPPLTPPSSGGGSGSSASVASFAVARVAWNEALRAKDMSAQLRQRHANEQAVASAKMAKMFARQEAVTSWVRRVPFLATVIERLVPAEDGAKKEAAAALAGQALAQAAGAAARAAPPAGSAGVSPELQAFLEDVESQFMSSSDLLARMRSLISLAVFLESVPLEAGRAELLAPVVQHLRADGRAHLRDLLLATFLPREALTLRAPAPASEFFFPLASAASAVSSATSSATSSTNAADVGDVAPVASPPTSSLSMRAGEVPLRCRACLPPFLVPPETELRLVVDPVFEGLYDGDWATACLPLRVIFAGGWSDTPPYTLECGGAVVNLAVRMGGKDAPPPVRATARVVKGRGVTVRSTDQGGAEAACSTLEELCQYDDPRQPLALHRAVLAFVLCPWRAIGRPHPNAQRQARSGDAGAASPGQSASGVPKLAPGEESLGRLLEHFLQPGLGLELETDVCVPKGTGLGTSSILILACLRAVRGLFERRYWEGAGLNGEDRERILQDELNAVMAVEQMLTTGGGYQDQAGGAIPGVKLIRSTPGIVPTYSVSRVEMDEAHRAMLSRRMLIVYSGRQRLAREILTNIVDLWFSRAGGLSSLLNEIRAEAERTWPFWCKFAATPVDALAALREEDDPLAQIGRSLSVVYALNTRLEPSFTTPYLEALLGACAPYVHGANIIGAGGGGYVVAMLKTPVEEMRRQCQEQLRKDGFVMAEMVDVEACEESFEVEWEGSPAKWSPAKC